MKTIEIAKLAGEFGENKDVAKRIRTDIVLPSLENDGALVLDFSGMTGVTQSFIHAMIAKAIRKYPETFFEKVSFKNCTDLVKTVIGIVSDYMQESLTGDDR